MSTWYWSNPTEEGAQHQHQHAEHPGEDLAEGEQGEEQDPVLSVSVKVNSTSFYLRRNAERRFEIMLDKGSEGISYHLNLGQ